MVVADVVLAWALFVLFRRTHARLSLLSGWLRLVNATIFGLALYHLFHVKHLLSGAEYLSALEPSKVTACRAVRAKRNAHRRDG